VDCFICIFGINALKVNNASGVKEQNVVLGIELGGLVARYALAKMTKAGTPTDTRLLITHDAPHQGAYMPLGYQHLVEDFGGMQMGGGRFRDLIDDFKEFNALKNSPVFNQFYLHRVNNGAVVNNNFLSPTNTDPLAYHQMVNIGFTPNYQFIATSQGSQCGSPVLTPGVNMMKFENEIQNFNIYKKSWKVGSIKFTIGPIPVWIDLKTEVSLDQKYKLKLGVNALPTSGSSKEISKSQLDRVITLKTKFKVCPYSICITVGSVKIVEKTFNMYSYSRYSPANIQPFESYAGGTNNLQNSSFKITQFIEPSMSNIGGVPVNGAFINVPFYITYTNSTYSYISRVSALDIANPITTDYTQPLIQPLNGLNRSRASKYVCQEATTVGGATFFNLASGRFTKRNAQWMFKTMENQSTLAEDCSSFEDCYNNNSFAISGDEVVCTSKSYTISNLPTAISIQWSVAPASIATISASTAPTTALTLNSNGESLLTATLSNACFVAPIVINKEIYLGPPPTNFTMLGSQISGIAKPTVWGFSAPYFTGANYFWYRDNAKLIGTFKNYVDFPVPCGVQFDIKCKISNACGMSNYSNVIATTKGFCQSIGKKEQYLTQTRL
jgi:hypothetical protein